MIISLSNASSYAKPSKKFFGEFLKIRNLFALNRDFFWEKNFFLKNE